MGLQSEMAAMQREEAKIKDRRRQYAEARKALEALGLSAGENKILSNVARMEQEMEQPFNEAVERLHMFSNDSAAAIIATRIEPVNEKLLGEIERLAAIQQASGRQVREQTAVYAERLHVVLYLLGAIAVAFGTVCAYFITRSIVTPLRSAVEVATSVAAGDLSSEVNAEGRDETAKLMHALKNMTGSLREIIGEVRDSSGLISTASKELARGNADLSQRTEEQASSLEETASSMEELTGTVKQNADNARQANQLASGASEVAARGGAVVDQVVQTMSSINESSKKIVDIIGVIDGIAFQTNILALNAAVEAARAGEQGRGFAVVASEVRSLAQRSAAAAKEIKALIGDSVDKVDAGTKLVDEAGKTMEQIVASVKRVTDIMAEITAASQEQSSGIEQVNKAITQMDEMTQQNSALVEQASAAAQSMKEQAQSLEKAVAIFKLKQASEADVDVQKPVQGQREPNDEAAPTAIDRRGPNRARNVARLPDRQSPDEDAALPAKLAQAGGDGWEAH
jgi:methyl-accepting chemotaxis protein